MKFAAHAVLFGEKIKTNTEEIMQQFKDMNYQGMEVGFRFFPAEDMPELVELLNRVGMTISGFHTLVFFNQLITNEVEVQSQLEKQAGIMQEFGFSNLIMSGIPSNEMGDLNKMTMEQFTKTQQKELVEKLDDLAKLLKSKYNVQIFYHNHCWEFEQEAYFFNKLLQETSSLKLGMDVGWVAVEGYNPAQIIKENPDKIGYLHLRDCNTNEEDLVGKSVSEKSLSFTDLDEGTLPIQDIIKALEATPKSQEKWIVIEYEKGEVSYERYQKAYDSLEKILKG
ncbi:sugar phosphate isomerase/epimerase family protein [Streptococcus moroccensis]|uniref:Sugar phosphate isomerase/epimerase n=1 Tax=Streptococcus moroccensis TaxID=1451356 RepID=A0ABT9YTB7_9STRE|nr:sugar phosphate isomerase/epimerase [Streptococcus moroccensis]MDQ0222603.1 sugar phosphate isomerase/epimerase [Streptococcus moroccensis]